MYTDCFCVFLDRKTNYNICILLIITQLTNAVWTVIKFNLKEDWCPWFYKVYCGHGTYLEHSMWNRCLTGNLAALLVQLLMFMFLLVNLLKILRFETKIQPITLAICWCSLIIPLWKEKNHCYYSPWKRFKLSLAVDWSS